MSNKVSTIMWPNLLSSRFGHIMVDTLLDFKNYKKSIRLERPLIRMINNQKFYRELPIPLFGPYGQGLFFALQLSGKEPCVFLLQA